MFGKKKDEPGKERRKITPAKQPGQKPKVEPAPGPKFVPPAEPKRPRRN
ncbi:MAG: hypothetical protein HMLIMOIP_002568 [Candidatus Nitrosomirales archaeon]|jgi:hypothetical protein